MFNFRTPKELAGPEFGPLVGLMSDLLISGADLADHWGYTETHLSNLRKAGKGVPWIKLPTGGIRYRMSEVLSAELSGRAGPLSLEHVLLAVSACKAVPAEHRATLLEHLKAALDRKWADGGCRRGYLRRHMTITSEISSNPRPKTPSGMPRIRK